MTTGVQVDPPRTRPHGPPTPGDIALELTGRDYLSYSAVSTYQRCPLKYYFSYIAGLAPEFVSSSLVFGGAVHSALEHHCRRVLEGAPLPSIDDLMAAYGQAWRDEDRAPVRFGKNETIESLRGLARRMLEAFQASEVSKLDGELLAVEEEFRGPVIDGCPDLLGRIDLVILTRDEIRIVDFKTSRSSWNESKVQEAAAQQLLYCELIKPIAESYPDRQVRVQWTVLTKGKSPTVERHTLLPEHGQIERTKAVVQRVWRAIEQEHFFPSPSAMSCSTCPFQNACRSWEG